MVRHPYFRTRKYENKIDADVIRSRFLAHRDVMIEQEAMKFTDLATFETQIKDIIEAEGVPTFQIPFYLNFGRECYRISERFTGATANNEASFAADKWVQRGLLRQLLAKIAALFGLTIPAY